MEATTRVMFVQQPPLPPIKANAGSLSGYSYVSVRWRASIWQTKNKQRKQDRARESREFLRARSALLVERSRTASHFNQISVRLLVWPNEKVYMLIWQNVHVV